jgi:hypothetical protein
MAIIELDGKTVVVPDHLVDAITGPSLEKDTAPLPKTFHSPPVVEGEWNDGGGQAPRWDAEKGWHNPATGEPAYPVPKHPDVLAKERIAPLEGVRDAVASIGGANAGNAAGDVMLDHLQGTGPKPMPPDPILPPHIAAVGKVRDAAANMLGPQGGNAFGEGMLDSLQGTGGAARGHMVAYAPSGRAYITQATGPTGTINQIGEGMPDMGGALGGADVGNLSADLEAHDKAQAAAKPLTKAQQAYLASPEGKIATAEGMYEGAIGSANDANAGVAAVDAAAARDQYDEKLKAQQEVDRINTERARVTAEREKMRQQKATQVDRYVHDADNFKIDENKFWGDASTAKNIGRIIAMAMTGLGQALMGRGHEQNPVIAMFDQMARQSIQMQQDKRSQMEKRADRAQQGLGDFDRISDSTDARFNAQMARAYQRGIQMGDLAVAKYGDKRADANWKAQRAELEMKLAEHKDKAAGAAWDRDVQRQNLANQKRQTDISAGHLGLAGRQFKEGVRQFDKRQGFEELQFLANNDYRDRALDVEAAKAAATGKATGAKVQLEQGVAAPPKVVIDAEGNVTVNRDTGDLVQADGKTPWIIPTDKEAIAFREKKEAAESIIAALDEIREIRERVGGESSWGNSDDYQRLQVLKDNLVALKKSGMQGMSSDADMARIERMLGADSPASFRAQAAKLDEGREQVIKQLNVAATNKRYTGKPLEYPDPLKFKPPAKTADQQGAESAMSYQPGHTSIASDAGIDTSLMSSGQRIKAEADALRQTAGVPPSVRQTIDSLAATANSDTVPAKARSQARALLDELTRNAESDAVKAYASQSSAHGAFTGPTQNVLRKTKAK